MRALWPGLFHPLFQTGIAGKFGAMRAHHRLLNRAKADEAAEEFVKLDLAVRSTATAAIHPNPRVNRLYARSTVIGPS